MNGAQIRGQPSSPSSQSNSTRGALLPLLSQVLSQAYEVGLSLSQMLCGSSETVGLKLGCHSGSQSSSSSLTLVITTSRSPGALEEDGEHSPERETSSFHLPAARASQDFCSPGQLLPCTGNVSSPDHDRRSLIHQSLSGKSSSSLSIEELQLTKSATLGKNSQTVSCCVTRPFTFFQKALEKGACTINPGYSGFPLRVFPYSPSLSHQNRKGSLH